jgi:hypothetical protein
MWRHDIQPNDVQQNETMKLMLSVVLLNVVAPLGDLFKVGDCVKNMKHISQC